MQETGTLDIADELARLGAGVLDEMPANVAKRLQAGLSAQERQLTAALLGYPPESAGHVTSPEFVNVRASMTAADALAKVRRTGGAVSSLRVLPVTDGQRRLVGVVDLPTVVTAEPSATVGSSSH